MQNNEPVVSARIPSDLQPQGWLRVHAIEPPRSILVIRMSGIGDVLWSTPLLANLRRTWPEAHIAYVVRPGSALVLENNPDVDEILLFESEQIGWQAGFLTRLAQRRFDLSLDIICSPATALQSWVAARTRVGFDFRVRRHFYTRCLSRVEANKGHAVEFNLAAGEAVGMQVATKDLVWNLSAVEEEFASRAFTELGLHGSRVVALVPTGGHSSKKWPADRYGALARVITGDPERRVLVLWGNEQEQADAQSIAAAGGEHAIAAPKWTLRQTAAVLSRCAAVIGNDTGPLHVATALGVPVIGVLGPVHDLSQGPWSTRAVYVRAAHLDEPCCGQPRCDFPRCMFGITVEQVAAVLDIVLGTPEAQWPEALAPLGARLRDF